MGGITSRRNSGVERVDINSTNAYKYPPKSGSYFGTHFIMGGERFDMGQPEAYLFGENSDLNFLGNKPIPFPYPASQGNEPTKTLKSLVNIRRDSLKFVKVQEAESENPPTEEDTATATAPAVSSRYSIEFTFDSDVRCAITIYYLASEDICNGHIVYHPRNPSMSSETYHYKKGANQTFSHSEHIVNPSKFPDDEWQYNFEKEILPIVIQCVVEEEEYAGHAHMTFAVVDRSSADGGYILKPLKQKQFVDGLPYLLQEIYGIENKLTEKCKVDPDDEVEDSGAECVICMSEMRDTLILPCRHLCLCSGCAESLRYQVSSCPICRSPFRALLQIRAMRKKRAQTLTVQVGDNTEENIVCQEGVPPGYEAVSLIEALNGPCGLIGETNPMYSMIGGMLQPVRIVPMIEMDGYQREKQRSMKKHHTIDGVKDGSDKKVQDGELQNGRVTPEFIMTDQMPDPVKSLTGSLKKTSRNGEKKDSSKSPRSKKKSKEVPREWSEDEMMQKSSEKEEVDKIVTETSPKSEQEIWELYKYAEKEGRADVPSDAMETEEEQTDNDLSTRLSTEDLADDEREDSTDSEQETVHRKNLEPEPEPDYEDSTAPEESLTEETKEVDCSPPTYSSVVYVVAPEEAHIDSYTVIQDGHAYPEHSHEALNEIGASSTEGSSFSSTCSAQGLLPVSLSDNV